MTELKSINNAQTLWDVEEANLVVANSNKELVAVSENNVASLEIAYISDDKKYMYILMGEVKEEGQETSDGYAKTINELVETINKDKVVNKYFKNKVTSPSQEQVNAITV